MDPGVILEKDFVIQSSSVRSSIGFVCKYCGSGRMRRSGAIKHAASRKHRVNVPRLGHEHEAASAPALAKYSFLDSTDEHEVDNTELGSEQGMWEQNTCPTPGRAIGSSGPPENDPGAILAAMGIPATPHVVQCAQVSGFVDYVETIYAATHVRFSGYRYSIRQALLEDPDIKERPGFLRYLISQARSSEVILEEMVKLKEEVAKLQEASVKLSVTDLKRKAAIAAKIFVATPFLLCHRNAAPIFAEALLRFGTVTRGVWDSDLEFQTEALSIFSTALATARSDLHKLGVERTHLYNQIGRVQRKEVDMLQALRVWYKDSGTTYTDEHLAWWSFLRLVEQTVVERGFEDTKRDFWLHLSGIATTVANKAAERFFRPRFCPNGTFDCSTFLYRAVVSQFYDADASPTTTQPKVSTTDSTFQAQCMAVITTCQPVADFQRLVLEAVQRKEKG
ncbi:BQ5605_C020g09183 [Microbotryum silenes-dioicae]|uniref:BQ5605_C020g09183 protein n=1 Tax=Microbotryum silenes-dioicae TaxID=796604 RepID=A0A2X0NCL0_9BASI|nr:BQ5605_C020g09183 [Microbotryum silenes-dioicae]